MREAFYDAETEEQLEAILVMTCSERDADSVNIFKAYQAVATTRMAEHAFWPTSKLSWFNEGTDSLDACVERHKNLETVYLRLVVALNAPGILGYNDHIESDRKYVWKQMKRSAIPRKYITIMEESITEEQ